jgi:hypothetical protein
VSRPQAELLDPIYTDDVDVLVAQIAARLQALAESLSSKVVNASDVAFAEELEPNRYFSAARTMFLARVDGLIVDASNTTDSDEVIGLVDFELRVVQTALVLWHTEQREGVHPDGLLAEAFEQLPTSQARLVGGCWRMLSGRAWRFVVVAEEFE